MVHQGCRGLALGVGAAVTDQFSTIWACGTLPGQSQRRLAYQFSDVLPREQAHARAARRATPRDSTRATPPHPAARAVPLDARPMPPRCFFSGSRTPRTRHCVLATSRRGARPRRRTHVSASSFHPLPPRTACGACRASAAPLGLAHPLALVLPAAHWRLARRAEPTPPRPPPRALRRANRTQTSTPCRNIPTARRISAWRASDRRFRLAAAFRVDPSS